MDDWKEKITFFFAIMDDTHEPTTADACGFST